MKAAFFSCALAIVCAAASSSAQIITETRTFTVNADILDPSDPPMLFTATINDSFISSLTRVEIGLHLVGSPANNGFASDMFVSLNFDFGPTSVLLNRVGITESNPVGYFYDGWNVSFRDDAPNGDVHLVDPGPGVLTGVYEPDGRISPSETTRTAMLDVFNGSPGNGEWRLAVGDLSENGQMRLMEWSITMTGTAIPEPSAFTLLSLGTFALFARRSKR